MATCTPLRRHSQLRLRSRFLVWAGLSLAFTAGGLALGSEPALAAPACLTDTAGADDINANQKDLNEFCQSAGNDGGPSGCLLADAYLTWTWDDTGWTGSNTGDACALYDTDGDRKANFALCESVGANPAAAISGNPHFYTCDNSKALNCGGSAARTSASSCVVANVADPFTGTHKSGNVCTGTNCSTRDTQAQCCVKHGDFPSNTTPELLDVCSYPSSSPSSSPSECVKAVICTNDSDCGALSDACNTGSCVSDGLTKRCVATPKANTTTCNDGDACTTGDTCQNGTCTGTSVTCSASDQCHVAGTCDSSTGQCSNPTKTDGTGCNDGDACTSGDSCQSGTCGGTPVTCSASDQCHVAGTCDPGTGQCSNPSAANGTGCNDGNACTQTDTCQNGMCSGGNPVVCSAGGQCESAGTCDPASGQCSQSPVQDGTACSDGNACTTGDSCQSGSCTSGAPVVCTASDQCHVAGTCDPASGQCSNPNAADGTGCNDNDACTRSDTCKVGSCVGGNPVVCTASDQCHVAGTCDSTSGQCSNPDVANGTGCNDGNACTQSDACQGGSCVGGSPVSCTASDQCHAAGVCDPSSGSCSNPTATNGTSCSDGDACTVGDTCQAGSCSSGTTKTCTALDQCHVAGVCNPSTGNCSNPNATDGTSCSDGIACTLSDTCQSGTCVGGNGPSSQPGCKNDTGGADDAVGQKDLSQFCVNTSASCTGTVFTWQWDDTAWTGTNSGDACALYDTDGNNRADLALCVSVTGQPAGQAVGSPRFYSCNNSKQFNCAGAALISAPGTSCIVNDLVADPFAALSRMSNKCAGTSCLTKDTQARCCVGTASLPAGSTLIDVCSYPSQSPNSDPSECVKTVFCSSNADCTVASCTGTCSNIGGVNQCVF